MSYKTESTVVEERAKRSAVSKRGAVPTKRKIQFRELERFVSDSIEHTPPRFLTLSILVRIYPSQITISELAAMTGFMRSVIRSYLSFWTEEGMVEIAHKGVYQASGKAMQ